MYIQIVKLHSALFLITILEAKTTKFKIINVDTGFVFTKPCTDNIDELENYGLSYEIFSVF